jgi:hypothetical protein
MWMVIGADSEARCKKLEVCIRARPLVVPKGPRKDRGFSPCQNWPHGLKPKLSFYSLWHG